MLYIDSINAIDLNAIAFTYDVDVQVYTYLVKNFNNYSKENNLDINIHLNLITPANSTTEINDYGNFLESLLIKKTLKYDLIFYDNIYSFRYGAHLINLYDILPKEHINMYNPQITSQSCAYQDEIVGLVTIIKKNYLL